MSLCGLRARQDIHEVIEPAPIGKPNLRFGRKKIASPPSGFEVFVKDLGVEVHGPNNMLTQHTAVTPAIGIPRQTPFSSHIATRPSAYLIAVFVGRSHRCGILEQQENFLSTILGIIGTILLAIGGGLLSLGVHKVAGIWLVYAGCCTYLTIGAVYITERDSRVRTPSRSRRVVTWSGSPLWYVQDNSRVHITQSFLIHFKNLSPSSLVK